MDPPLQSESPALRQKTSGSQVPSCVSINSDASKQLHNHFKGEHTSEDRKKTLDSQVPSCVSIKSDASKQLHNNFKGDRTSEDRQKRLDSPEPSCLSMRSDKSKGHLQLKKNKSDRSSKESQKISDAPECSCRSVRSDVSKHDGFKDDMTSENSIKLKTKLRKKFQHLHEGILTKQGNPTLLNEIYTELYITEGREFNDEYEIRQIETAAKRAAETADKPINCRDIFKPLPGQNQAIRFVLTKGFAGIGKTVSAQKFSLDWAEGKGNQDIHLIFPLPFRELNFIKDKLSLLDLLRVFFPETVEMDISHNKVLFIFDGLDECRFPLNFKNNETLNNVTKETSVDVLLTNLILGNLFPSALIWITSRPAAADLIPYEHVNRVTEVRGFNDPQKEEYFRKRITDQSLANKIISHLKSSRSLYIMCHIPVFCWISATVLEKMLSGAESAEIPKTLTQMYTHFLILQTNIKHEKDYEKKLSDEDMILKLGKLAFQELMKRNVMFYEEDLRECGIDVTEASVYSGLCTQIFREEFGPCQRKVYCFVHLSIQEHLAALFVHHSFTIQNINVFVQMTESTHTQVPIFNLHQRAVDETLESKNRHLGLFLRFLLGFSLESNQALLKVLLTQTESRNHNLEDTVNYIKKKVEEHTTPEKLINLFHCLNDLGDNALVEQILHYLKCRALTTVKMSPLHWSAVVFVLLTSENLDVFELKKYMWKTNCSQMEQVLRHLVPVLKASKSVLCTHCELNTKCCAPLAIALASEYSCIKEMNLNGNEIRDSGVELLSEGLGSSHCTLEILRLNSCGVTNKGCASLALALGSNPLHLKHLDLSFNELGDGGVKCLSDSLCTIQKLKLRNCNITDEGCAALASALTSNPSLLKELDLSRNKVRDLGTKLLSATLRNPECQLKVLKLKDCGLTDEGCAALASALSSNPSHMKELDLSENKLGDSGMKFLAKGPKCPPFGLEELWLTGCGITHEGCADLASALTSNLSQLKELNLSGNIVGDPGLKRLSAALESADCKLETLGLNDCGVRDDGCVALISSLTSNTSHLSKLHLSGNDIGTTTMERLSALQALPDNKLKKVNLSIGRSESFTETENNNDPANSQEQQ
ncbi:NACHT, LRR and PYD domains-containing protein 12-like [Pseudorasbora parva]|uniref:NACHT, LRR and PYD domains-containing protein 12-like n=1 Tax=Pseudorasbora parva TaxID=51549 RepID=UPI00351F4AEB